MVFHWLNHTGLKRKEKLILMLYDLGIATKEQIEELTGWTTHGVENVIKAVRNLADPGEDRRDWIRPVYMPKEGKTVPCAYKLGSKGIGYAEKLLNMESTNKKEASSPQVVHFVYLNEILIRFVRSFKEYQLKGDISWYSSSETFALIAEYWKRHVYPRSEVKENEEDIKIMNQWKDRRKTLSRPDALLVLDNKRFYIEFDNDTENSRKIEQKFHRYIQTITPYGPRPDEYKKIKSTLNYPVVWVTTSDKRKNHLQTWYAKITESYYSKVDIKPNMYFFVEGEETLSLLDFVNLIQLVDH
jgi:hypothetical protein